MMRVDRRHEHKDTPALVVTVPADEAGCRTGAGRSWRWRDRTGEVVGHLTLLRHVGTDRDGFAVWACRCDCGRPDCPGEVERSTHTLRNRRWPDCRSFPKNARPRADGAEPPTMPEGLRPPWTRTPDERAARDARLLAAFAEADLR